MAIRKINCPAALMKTEFLQQKLLFLSASAT